MTHQTLARAPPAKSEELEIGEAQPLMGTHSWDPMPLEAPAHPTRKRRWKKVERPSEEAVDPASVPVAAPRKIPKPPPGNPPSAQGLINKIKIPTPPSVNPWGMEQGPPAKHPHCTFATEKHAKTWANTIGTGNPSNIDSVCTGHPALGVMRHWHENGTPGRLYCSRCWQLCNQNHPAYRMQGSPEENPRSQQRGWDPLGLRRIETTKSG